MLYILVCSCGLWSISFTHQSDFPFCYISVYTSPYISLNMHAEDFNWSLHTAEASSSPPQHYDQHQIFSRKSSWVNKQIEIRLNFWRSLSFFRFRRTTFVRWPWILFSSRSTCVYQHNLCKILGVWLDSSCGRSSYFVDSCEWLFRRFHARNASKFDFVSPSQKLELVLCPREQKNRRSRICLWSVWRHQTGGR